NLHYTTMTEYDEKYTFPVVIEKHFPAHVLGAVCEVNNLTNLRTAETEKYPHVTYFFNGGQEKPFKGEEREVVASRKDVATYDLAPEMSAAGVCDVVVKGIESQSFDVIIVNFANGDMVGHTGVIPAAVKAIETVDACLGRIVDAVHASGGTCLVTADHGNADNMLEPDGSPNTAHSLNPVPLILTVPGPPLAEGGILADVAPTVLEA